MRPTGRTDLTFARSLTPARGIGSNNSSPNKGSVAGVTAGQGELERGKTNHLQRSVLRSSSTSARNSTVK
jgi:hypothetical protein